MAMTIEKRTLYAKAAAYTLARWLKAEQYQDTIDPKAIMWIGKAIVDVAAGANVQPVEILPVEDDG